MIQVSVKNSTDLDKLGQFTFGKNLIYIGKEKGCDLYINDDEINYSHIFIEIIKDKLLCHLSSQTEFILVNGKRTTGNKYLKIGDTIKIGSTLLVIDSFLFQDLKKHKDELNRLTEKLIQNDKKLVNILKEIQNSSL